jgi:hypothetical protein
MFPCTVVSFAGVKSEQISSSYVGGLHFMLVLPLLELEAFHLHFILE